MVDVVEYKDRRVLAAYDAVQLDHSDLLPISMVWENEKCRNTIIITEETTPINNTPKSIHHTHKWNRTDISRPDHAHT